MKPYYLIVIILASLVMTPAHAQDKTDFSALALTGEAQVERVIDPIRIQLLDQRIIQLTGLDIPDLSPYEMGPIAKQAKSLLEESLIKKHIKIYQSKHKDERKLSSVGFTLAHIALKADDRWIQDMLLGQGLARVRPTKSHNEMALAMLKIEAAARDEKKGLWQDPQYSVLTPETAKQALHKWGVVEGIVRASAMRNNYVELNFGSDWRKDFTVGIDPELRREMNNKGMQPLQYANKKIRVRGIIEEHNGPYINLLSPLWIELLQDDP